MSDPSQQLHGVRRVRLAHQSFKVTIDDPGPEVTLVVDRDSATNVTTLGPGSAPLLSLTPTDAAAPFESDFAVASPTEGALGTLIRSRGGDHVWFMVDATDQVVGRAGTAEALSAFETAPSPIGSNDVFDLLLAVTPTWRGALPAFRQFHFQTPDGSATIAQVGLAKKLWLTRFAFDLSPAADRCDPRLPLALAIHLVN